MDKVKALLYCRKERPYLVYKPYNYITEYQLEPDNDYIRTNNTRLLNGTVGLICDFKAERLYKQFNNPWKTGSYERRTKTTTSKQVIKASGVDIKELEEYLKLREFAYVINLNNLEVLEGVKSDLKHYNYATYDKVSLSEKDIIDVESHIVDLYPCKSSPKNMVKVFTQEGENIYTYVAIAVTAEEMYRILNGKQTALIRKQILRGLI